MDEILNSAPKLVEEIEGFAPLSGVATAVCRSAGAHDPLQHGAIGAPIIPPISLSTTFQQASVGVYKYDYSRSNNYSREILERTIAAVERGKYCSTFASGLAATNALMQTLKTGDHVIAFDDLYGGTNRLFRRILTPMGITFEFVDLTVPERILEHIKDNTRVVWLESPSNPLMQLVDISVLCKLVKEKRDDIIVVVDNTLMSSMFQSPLDLGAHVVAHSLTKYMNGHADVVMGALVTRDEKLASRLQFIQFAGGAVPAPFDCYLVLRGLRTLPCRMREHMRNGLAVARFLEKHPNVERVLHPGLTSHPQYDLARKQQHGYSGMLSMYVKGDREYTRRVVRNFKVFTLAESLGGFESLSEIPYDMTHTSVPEEQRIRLGITENLIRLSVGLEDLHDMLEDLDQSLRLSVEEPEKE